MILYTEKQLEEAWILHCAEIIKHNAHSSVKLPTPEIEEFRTTYEEVLEDIYENGG